MCVFGLDLCTRFASVGFFFLFIAIFLVFGWFATDFANALVFLYFF